MIATHILNPKSYLLKVNIFQNAYTFLHSVEFEMHYIDKSCSGQLCTVTLTCQFLYDEWRHDETHVVVPPMTVSRSPNIM